MIAHDHRELVHGCFRCALNVDEEQAAILDELWDERWKVANAYEDRDVREAYEFVRSSLRRYGELAVWRAEERRRDERNAGLLTTSADPAHEPVD